MQKFKRDLSQKNKSTIISFLSLVFGKISKSIKNSKLLSFFYNYHIIENLYQSSILHEKSGKFQTLKHKLLLSKIKFAKKAEQSILLNWFDNIGLHFFSASVRSFGVFFLSFGGILQTLTIATNPEIITSLNFSETFIFGCFLVILSLFLLPISKSLSACLSDGYIFSFFFVDLLYVKHLERKDAGKSLSVSSFSLFYGLVCGVLSYLTSPKLIMFLISFVFIIYLIGTRPENGVLITCLALPFFSEKFLAFIIIFTIISDVFKIMRGKRSLHFNICSGSLLVIAIIITSTCLISFDKQGAFASVSHIFLSIIFSLFVIMIVNSSNLAKKCLKMLALSSILTCLFTIYKIITPYFINYNISDISLKLSDNAVSLMFSQTQYLAVFLVATIPIFYLRKKTTSGFLSTFALVISIISLIFTNSYSGMIALVVSLVFSMLVFSKFGLWVITIVLALIYTAKKIVPDIAPVETINNYLRGFTENAGTVIFADSSALKDFFLKFWSYGAGSGNKAIMTASSLTESTITYYSGFGETPINISMHIGIPLTLIVILLLFLFITKILTYALSHKVSSDTRIHESIIIASLIGIITFSMYTNILLDFKTTMLTFLILSLGSAIADSSDNDFIVPGTVYEDIY